MPLKFISSTSTNGENELNHIPAAVPTPLQYFERRIPQQYIEIFRISDEEQLEELKKIWAAYK